MRSSLGSSMAEGCLLRLPMYFDLSTDEVARICGVIVSFYGAAQC